MKKIIIAAVGFVFTACGHTDNVGTTENTTDDAAPAVENVAVATEEDVTTEPAPEEVKEDNFPAQEKVARELYKACVFGGNTGKLKKLCTPAMLKRLRNANEYDDGGYAVWCLRTEAQDGDGPSKVVSVTPDGDDAVIVKYKDMGHSGSTRLVFVLDGDTWKVDNATTPSGKKIL